MSLTFLKKLSIQQKKVDELNEFHSKKPKTNQDVYITKEDISNSSKRKVKSNIPRKTLFNEGIKKISTTFNIVAMLNECEKELEKTVPDKKEVKKEEKLKSTKKRISKQLAENPKDKLIETYALTRPLIRKRQYDDILEKKKKLLKEIKDIGKIGEYNATEISKLEPVCIRFKEKEFEDRKKWKQLTKVAHRHYIQSLYYWNEADFEEIQKIYLKYIH
jgi:hypothetical protein